MQEALKNAEIYIDRQHIDISSYWLYRAVYLQLGGENAPETAGWHFWWVSDTGTLGDDVEIFVYMNGKASRLPSL